MSKEFWLNPFGELIGLNFTEASNGSSKCVLEVDEKLLNPNNVLHGGVMYSMADAGMAEAIHPGLNQGELCATVEIKISYFRPVTSGTLTCDTRIINRGRKIVALESEIKGNDERLVAKAMGTFYVFEIA